MIEHGAVGDDRQRQSTAELELDKGTRTIRSVLKGGTFRSNILLLQDAAGKCPLVENDAHEDHRAGIAYRINFPFHFLSAPWLCADGKVSLILMHGLRAVNNLPVGFGFGAQRDQY